MQEQINKLEFNGKNIYVGIDVHKISWTVTIVLDQITHKTFTQPPSANTLGNYLRKNFPGGNYYSAYEAGFSGFSTHRSLEKEGIVNIVVNPSDIPTTDKDKRQKEDMRDSRKIAYSLKQSALRGIHIPRGETEELRSLLKCRVNLVKDISRYKNRVKSVLFQYGINIPENFASISKHFSNTYINWLKGIQFQTASGNEALESLISTTIGLRQELLKMNRKIRVVYRSPKYKELVGILTSIPGIGEYTAIVFIAFLEDMRRFYSLDDLCSYVGLIPSTNSSGENEKTGKITRRSNKVLRGLIIESAWIAARRDPALLMAYQTLCERMKPSKAIIRVAKKLLSRMRYVWMNNERYEYAVVA
jgi:transposase